MMHAYRSVHDFPRLAKESGFYFHFRPKKVEWAEIAKIDVDDIADNQRFEEIEDNLELILNCNLDEEVTKLLDRDFVKLFRLAQLSVGYLRHCQLYLDRCIVLLQDQLSEALKECESVKESHGRDIFQCVTCKKTFLTVSYLESHQRRRHSATNKQSPHVSVSVQTDQSDTKPPVKTISQGQQTDKPRTGTSETQTMKRRSLDIGTMTVSVKDYEEISTVNEQLKTLHKRIEAVEAKAATSKVLDSNESAEAVTSYNQQNTQLNNSVNMDLLLNNLAALLQAQEAQRGTKDVAVTIKQEPLLIDFSAPTVSNPQSTVMQPLVKAKETHDQGWSIEESDEEDGNNSPVPFLTAAHPPAVQIQPKAASRTRRKVLITAETAENSPQPKPRLRTSTLARQKTFQFDEIEEFEGSNGNYSPDRTKQSMEVKMFLHEDAEAKQTKHQGATPDSKQLSPEVMYIKQKSTEIPYQQVHEETPSLTMQNIKEERQSLTQETIREKSPIGTKSKSFFKNLVRRNSPNLKGLKKTLKNSWSSLYDSKTPSPREKMGLLNRSRNTDSRSSPIDFREGREVVLDDGVTELLDIKLKELGVNPEWTGIPDESLDRAMAALKHQQNTKAMKRPKYSKIRQQLETMVERRLQEIEHKETIYKPSPAVFQKISPLERSNMYDMDSETESDDYVPTIAPVTTNIADLIQNSLTRNGSNAKKEISESLNVFNREDGSPKQGEKDESEVILPTNKVPQSNKDASAPPKKAVNPKEKETQSAKDKSVVAPYAPDKPTLSKDTDFSIFQVGPKQTSSPLSIVTDVSSDESSGQEKILEPVTLRSSILSKGREEVKKRVVFADNFELETNHELLDVGNKSSSSSSSDWDIPMP